MWRLDIRSSCVYISQSSLMYLLCTCVLPRQPLSRHGIDSPLLDELHAHNAEVIHLGRHQALTVTPWNSGCTQPPQTRYWAVLITSTVYIQPTGPGLSSYLSLALGSWHTGTNAPCRWWMTKATSQAQCSELLQWLDNVGCASDHRKSVPLFTKFSLLEQVEEQNQGQSR